MEKQFKVAVLLSSYNGEKYIREQIDSILNQGQIEVKLVVRDDGSTDATVEILKEYQSKGMLEYYQNETGQFADKLDKIGRSFFDLCKNAPAADYYAFADQDDVWDSGKLFAGIEKLRQQDNMDIPLLYCGRVTPVSENLLPAEYQPPKIKPKFLKYYRLLLTCTAAGCTYVFNRAALDNFLKFKGQRIGIHDWLFQKVTALNGAVIYDNNSYIKYRQHESNAHGAKKEGIRYLLEQEFSKKRDLRSLAAKEILESYRDVLDKKQMQFLEMLAFYKKSFGKKIKLLFSRKITGNTFVTKIGVKLLIICNRL